MGARSKPKPARGTTNDNRPNRKAYKEGKSPEVRAAEAAQKAAEKRERKSDYYKIRDGIVEQVRNDDDVILPSELDKLLPDIVAEREAKAEAWSVPGHDY